MGVLKCTAQEWKAIEEKVAQEMAAEKEATEKAGYVRLTGWFGAILEEFNKAHKFGPCYHRGGKIYGWLQIRYELGLDAEKNPHVNYDAPPADLAYWLGRKEFWKTKLNIDYDTNPPR